MPYVQSKEKIKYQGRVYNIHLGPRGGKYIQMNGGMKYVSKIVNMYEPTPELLSKIIYLLNEGIEEVFDVCKEKLNGLPVSHFANALLILFDFNTKYKKTDQGSCTCSPHGWGRLVPLSQSQQRISTSSIDNKHAQYMLACNFADYLYTNLTVTMQNRYAFYPKSFYKNAVDEFVNANQNSLKDIMSDCPMDVSEGHINLKNRVCSWHPMHDYIMRYVLKESPNSKSKTVTEVDTSKTFKVSKMPPIFERVPMRTQKSLLTEEIRNPQTLTSSSTYASTRSSSDRSSSGRRLRSPRQ